MSDRELVFAAAKAAGIKGKEYLGEPVLLVEWDDNRPIGKGLVVNGTRSGWTWCPLTDDGDALRLAVKLRIDLILWLNKGRVTAKTHIDTGRGISLSGENRQVENFHGEMYGDDDFAATRRAIVRAAAEIGKAHPATPKGGAA